MFNVLYFLKYALLFQNNFHIEATSAQQKWLLVSDYVKLIRKLEALPAYGELFMDAHYVILELLASIRSLCRPCDDAADSAKFAHRWSAFRQAIALLRECPAKLLLLQTLS